MPKEYELRLFDETLLTFTLEEKGIQGLVAHVTGVKSEKRSLLPLEWYGDSCDENLLQWLRRRVIPKNRTFVDEILKTLGLSVNDTKGYL